MSQNNDHTSKKVVDNRDGKWECENCQEKPSTVALTMRGGYLQEVLCSQCHTDLYPKEVLMGEGFGNSES